MKDHLVGLMFVQNITFLKRAYLPLKAKGVECISNRHKIVIIV